MATPERLPEIRRIFRLILKDALRCCARSTAARTRDLRPEPQCRTSSDPPCLPQLSRVSLFPDFGLDTFGIDHCRISPVSAIESLHSHLPFTGSESPLPLLPLTRLSQVDLSGLYACHTALPRRQLQYETLPEMLREGASQRASISTVKLEPSLRSTSSTLRIHQSSPFIANESQSTEGSGTSLASMSSLRKSAGFEDLRRNSSASPFAGRLLHPVSSEIFNKPTPAHSSHSSTRSSALIQSIKHFKSFCVLDTHVSGCPVTATSEDLRYIFQIGDQFILNLHECKGTSIDIVIGSSPDGDEVIHLVLFTPLLSLSTGMSRFLLVALIDVTQFVHEASQLPDLDTTNEESSFDNEVLTPAITPPQSCWSARHYELIPDDLLGGCSVPSTSAQSPANRSSSSSPSPNSSPAGSKRESDDIWLALARREQLEKDWRTWAERSNGESLGYSTPQSLGTRSTRVSKSSTTIDDVLDEFMMNLQMLYSESIVLARSPLDDKYYEICNVSPAVYASGEYITGHLTHTVPDVIECMSQRLGSGKPFRTAVRWGSHGIEKQLYCVPLYGQSSITWICVLVDLDMPDLW